jgi:hypothetical protein
VIEDKNAAPIDDVTLPPLFSSSLVMSGTLIFTAIVLLVWNIPYALKFFAFTISGVGYGESLLCCST